MAQELIFLIVLLELDSKLVKEMAIKKSTVGFPPPGICRKNIRRWGDSGQKLSAKHCESRQDQGHTVKVLGLEQDLNKSVPFLLLLCSELQIYTVHHVYK